MNKRRVNGGELEPEDNQDPLDEQNEKWVKDRESYKMNRQRVHAIAHDFNNILSSILANLQLAKTEIDAGSAGFQRLNSAEVGVTRARELSQELLAIGIDGEKSLSEDLDRLESIYHETLARDAGSRAAPSVSSGAQPKKQRILLMDDEEAILSATSEMLRFLKHEVSTAENGTLAVELYKQAFDAGTPFDVVILDITVPGGMGAKETLPALKAINPSVKTIISSGYVTDPMILNFSGFGFAAAMVKPYGFKELSEALNKAFGT